MKKIITIILFIVFIITSTLLATIYIRDGQKYIMTKDVVGITTDYEHYFEMQKASEAVLDGSENYYSVSWDVWPTPQGRDSFGLKMSGKSAKNDTIRRVTFYHCGDGIYIRGWGGGGGLIEDCTFNENKRWGVRSGTTGNCGIEIRDCMFLNNANGIAVKTADSMWVHFCQFNDTTTGLSLDGGPENQARYNLIEQNYFTEHENYGIEVVRGASNNTIRKNYLINDPIYVENSNDNLFSDNFITNCEIGIILNNGTGNIFERDTVENSLSYDVSLNNAAEAHFIGSVFDPQKVIFLDNDSKLSVSWYLNVTVTDNGPIEGAIVKCYKNNDELVVEDTTNSNGEIEKMVLLQLVMDANSTVSHGPFKVVTSKEGYPTDTTTVEVTENKSIEITLGETGVEDIRRDIPHCYAISQNYPNPFNPQTSITYQLPKSCSVSLKVYDINGRLVRTLVNEFQSPGYKSVEWDARDKVGNEVASGIYFYSLRAGDFKSTKRMVLMR